MMDDLIRRFERRHVLSDRCKTQLSVTLKSLPVAQGSLLVKQGDVSPHICFVTQGLLRGYFFIGREEFTSRYYAVGQTCFLPRWDRALEGLEAVDDTIVYRLDYDTMEQLGTRYPELLLVLNDDLQQEHDYLTQKQAALQSLNAYGKWMWFLGNHPKLMDRLTMPQIAAFLGVTPRSILRAKQSARGLTKNSF
jgi:CRP-like cAMP-binding protein